MKKLIDAAADFQKHAKVLEELGETLKMQIASGAISEGEAFREMQLASLRKYALDDFGQATHSIEMEEQHYRLTKGRNDATKKWKERRRREEGVPERAKTPVGQASQTSQTREFPALPEELTPEQREEISKLMRKGQTEGSEE